MDEPSPAAEAAREAAADGEDPVEAFAQAARSEAATIGPAQLPQEDRDAILQETASDAFEELWQTDPELAAEIAFRRGSRRRRRTTDLERTAGRRRSP